MQIYTFAYSNYYMEESALQWYAVKVFYNKVFDMESALQERGYSTYLAVDRVLLKGEAHILARRHIATLRADGKADPRYIEEGPVLFQRVPMVSSLLFVRAGANDINALDDLLKDAYGNAKGFIYKKRNPEGKYVCEAIPDKQMEAFRLVTSQGSEGLEFFSADDISCFAAGCKVRVTDGPFKGAEGYVKRIRRNRRLLVAIEGIVAVVSAYIDPRLLEAV